MIKVAAQLAYRNFQKRAVSRELAKRVLLSRALNTGLEDVFAASTQSGTVDKVMAALKKYPKTIRKAGPETQRLIYGPPAMELKMPESFTAHIWDPDKVTLNHMATNALGIRR